MLRSYGVPFYARRPRKAVSVYDEYGKKSEESVKARFESVKRKKVRFEPVKRKKRKVKKVS